MRVALCSDVHLRGPDDPNQGRFLRFIRELEADHLVLLGDVFDRWWHFDDAPFPAYAPVVDALASRGLPLTVLPGNHDFHAPAFFARRFGATVPGPDGFVHARWDGVDVHLHHGDFVDDSVGYRAISTLLRGRPFGAGVTALGPERAWRFLGALTGHGRVSPQPEMIRRQRAAAARLLVGGGEALVVFGHTHAPSLERLPGGHYLNLGDLLDSGTWGRVTGGVPTLERAAFGPVDGRAVRGAGEG